MNVTVTAVAYMMPHPSSYYVTQRTVNGCWTALMNDAVAAASADYPVDQTGGSYDFVGDYFPDIAPGYKIRGSRPASAPSGFGLAPEAPSQACIRA
jgi:hypothetical protein